MTAINLTASFATERINFYNKEIVRLASKNTPIANSVGDGTTKELTNKQRRHLVNQIALDIQQECKKSVYYSNIFPSLLNNKFLKIYADLVFERLNKATQSLLTLQLIKHLNNLTEDKAKAFLSYPIIIQMAIKAALKIAKNTHLLTTLEQGVLTATNSDITAQSVASYAELKKKTNFFIQVGNEGNKAAVTNIYKQLDTQLKEDKNPSYYHIATTFPSMKVIKGMTNPQHKITSRLLKGAHLFNKNLHNGNNLCFIQTIATTEGGALGYDGVKSWFKPSVLKEATLMTELALLSLLVQQADADKAIILAYHDIKNLYQDFLKNNTCHKDYFYDSKQGKLALVQLRLLKAEIKQATAPTTDNVSALISHAIQQIFVQDLHLNKDYGPLLQVLSMALQPNSNANSENQLINTLKAMLNKDKNACSSKEKGVISALQAFINNPTTEYNLLWTTIHLVGLPPPATNANVIMSSQPINKLTLTLSDAQLKAISDAKYDAFIKQYS